MLPKEQEDDTAQQPEPAADAESFAASVAEQELAKALAAQGHDDAPVTHVTPLIDGESGKADGSSVDLYQPATGELLARLTFATGSEVDDAVSAAVRALALWRQSPFAQRAETLRRLIDRIYVHAPAIAELIAREQGKPVVEAMNQEVLATLDHLRFMVLHAERYHAGLEVDPRHPYFAHKRAHYLYDAIGVLAIVTPSPLPFAIPMIQVAAALVMGNAVVLKPAEIGSLCAQRIGDLCLEAGFPAGAVNVVPAESEETLRLVSHPRVDKVFFTGGLQAGRTVMEVAGAAPRPVVLSLGGKHASVVDGDADLTRAAKGVVWGALSNAGQNCGAVERVFVDERVASKFLDLVLDEVDRLRVGNPLIAGVDLGPMQTAGRRRHVHRQVSEAVDGGARLLRGGSLPEGDGLFYPPTVLHDPPLDCALMRDETLGPVIPIVTVDNLERAILLANDTEFTLSASGWTQSAERAERLMVGLKAGVVTINDVLYSFGEPAATWSGYKKSGLGQNHGRPGLREMSRQRFVSFDAHPATAPLFAYPYDDIAIQQARHTLDHQHAPGRLRRFGAMLKLLRSKRFRGRVPARSLLQPRGKKTR